MHFKNVLIILFGKSHSCDASAASLERRCGFVQTGECVLNVVLLEEMGRVTTELCVSSCFSLTAVKRRCKLESFYRLYHILDPDFGLI